jgi:hypothetical protein
METVWEKAFAVLYGTGAPKGIKIRTLISLKLNVFRFQASIYGKHIALNE